jgi:hypothetical protein
MLNAKEKALDLVNKFQWKGDVARMSLDNADQCALICVNELIEIMDEEGYDEEDSEIAYLEEVKNQIHLL